MSRPSPRISAMFITVPEPGDALVEIRLLMHTPRGLRTLTVKTDTVEKAMAEALGSITGTVWYWNMSTEVLEDSGVDAANYSGPPPYPSDEEYGED
jgi:hypothetical protein